MLKVLSKLAEARTYIKSHPIKKDAKNEFSKYDYFSPELVNDLVYKACIETNTICIFSLEQDSLSYYGSLTFVDLESGEQITTTLRTDRPEIKATNITQQMGGMQTYAKRYALMSLFDIEDNTIDYDAQPPAKQPEAKKTVTNNTPPPTTNGDDKPWLNKHDPNYFKIINRLQNKTATLQQIKEHYKINKQVYAELEAAIKNEVIAQDDLPY